MVEVKPNILIIILNVNSLHNPTQTALIVRLGKKSQLHALNAIYERYILDSYIEIRLK